MEQRVCGPTSTPPKSTTTVEARRHSGAPKYPRTWKGETNTGASVQLDFTAKGTTLTGTLIRNGRSAPISDGKVSKDTFTFKATLNEQSEGFSGERSGDELRVWLDRQGRETAIVLRRAKRAAPDR